MAFDLLLKMQPSRKRRKEGEVFVIQPSKDTFFFGKVIRTNISINDPIMNGGHLVYIFNQTSSSMEHPEYLNPNHLIISPKIINNQGWTKGYFQTVGVQKVTDEEWEIDYGFWDIVTKSFVNEEGIKLNHKPKIFGDFGLGSYGSVAYELKKELDPSFEG